MSWKLKKKSTFMNFLKLRFFVVDIFYYDFIDFTDFTDFTKLSETHNPIHYVLVFSS